MYKAMLTAALVTAAGLALVVGANRHGGAGLDAVRAAVSEVVEPQGKVVVMIVRDRGMLERIRSGTERSRLRASSDDAFAVTPDRVVTMGAEEASEPIRKMGWSNRRIEFVDLGTIGGPGTTVPAALAPPPPGSDAALASKDTLTVGEALRYLKQQQ